MIKMMRTPLLILLFLMSACASPSPSPEPPLEVQESEEVYPSSDVAAEPEAGYPANQADSSLAAQESTTATDSYPAAESLPENAEPTPEPEPAQPTEPAVPAADFPVATQHHEFPSEDGLLIAATFYPPKYANAPLVVAFHQMGGSKNDWNNLALWMQNRGDELDEVSSDAAWSTPVDFFPALPADISFGVVAIDFRNHGDSKRSDASFDASGFLMDARAALAYAKSLPGVNPEQVITMGGSIGSDAALDTCLVLEGATLGETQIDQGCIGIVSFSPGNYLGVDYIEGVERLASAPFENINIYCLATEYDSPSTGICSTEELPGLFTGVIYPGSAHAVSLIKPDLDPEIGKLLHDFLLETLSGQ
jgi:pimeloyl-ACP methyl ester carboxylesterase